MFILIVFAAIYLIAANLVVEAALVPSFMEKLDSFSTFTEKGYAEQVYTDDIVTNEAAARSKTSEWLSSVEWRKLAAESHDGYRLIAAEFKQDDPSAPWALLLHGYTGWKEELYDKALMFYERGYSVLVPDLRCSGESEGNYIGMGWLDRDDNKLWLKYILTQSPDSDIVIFGQSMGASATLIMAAEELPANVKVCICDSAFRDPIELFKNKVKDWTGLPSFGLIDTANLMLQIRGGYDLHDAAALKAAGRARLPVLFIQGTEDKIVPQDNVYDLYDACVSDKDILVVEGTGHCQSCEKAPELYETTIFEFIDRHLASR